MKLNYVIEKPESNTVMCVCVGRGVKKTKICASKKMKLSNYKNKKIVPKK